MTQASSTHGAAHQHHAQASGTSPEAAESEFQATRIDADAVESDFPSTRFEEEDAAATPQMAPDWWSESTDGQCSENAALFAASQPAPLTIV